MGRLDESLLSTASTLIDSCSSLDASLDKEPPRDKGTAKENNVFNSKPIPGWKQPNLKYGNGGRIASAATYGNAAAIIEARNANIVSPIGSPFAISTNRFLLSTDHSIGESTTSTENSKLDILRTRNKLLRSQGSQKIAESRESLRNNRTVYIELPPHASPPAEKREELPELNTKLIRPLAASIMTGTFVKKSVDLPVLLRRSNNVIDQLTSQIATAGDIINQSSSHEVDMTIRLDTSALIRDEVITLPPVPNVEPFDDQASIENDENSLHNLSVDDEWDHSTISASAPDTPSRFDALTYSDDNITPPPSQSVNCSGLPPPEVVVKITAPRSPKPRSHAEMRHRKQRPPSLSPHRGDCASMYNTNQKCEKLSIENDCLKRQLDLLESRHRDWQRKLAEQIRDNSEQVPEAMRTPGSPTISTTSGTSKATSYRSYRNRRKKKNDRRRLAMLLLVAPFVLSWTVWFYRTVRDVSLSRRMNRDRSINDGAESSPRVGTSYQRGPTATLSQPALAGLATLMRDGVLRQTVLGPILFRDKSNGRVQSETTNSGKDENVDYADALPVVAAPKHRRIKGAPIREDMKSSSSRRNGSRLKRWLGKRLSKMKIQKENDMSGVWLRRARQIKTRELHAEL
mmetsp:Transcript_15114/g.42026  ORF Transcript_15114/g.42026 Transcript_15114/m.42026 type:complete len:630 (+) Transcript_15114:108-1997(+)